MFQNNQIDRRKTNEIVSFFTFCVKIFQRKVCALKAYYIVKRRFNLI